MISAVALSTRILSRLGDLDMISRDRTRIGGHIHHIRLLAFGEGHLHGTRLHILRKGLYAELVAHGSARTVNLQRSAVQVRFHGALVPDQVRLACGMLLQVKVRDLQRAADGVDSRVMSGGQEVLVGTSPWPAVRLAPPFVCRVSGKKIAHRQPILREAVSRRLRLRLRVVHGMIGLAGWVHWSGRVRRNHATVAPIPVSSVSVDTAVVVLTTT
jgi:hypothetical protein